MQRCTIFSNSGCKVIKKTLTSKYFSPFFVYYPKRIHQKAYIMFHLEQLYRLFVNVMGLSCPYHEEQKCYKAQTWYWRGPISISWLDSPVNFNFKEQGRAFTTFNQVLPLLESLTTLVPTYLFKAAGKFSSEST